MFDRFLRFTAVRRAIEREHYEHAFELLDDRSIREHRKAEDLRARCLERLLVRFDRRLELGEIGLAKGDLELLLMRCPADTRVAARQTKLDEVRRAGQDAAASRDRVRKEIRAALQGGELAIAELRIGEARRSEPDAPDLVDLARSLSVRREEVGALIAAARECLDAGDLKTALDRVLGAKARHPHAPELREIADELARRRARAWERGEVLDLATTEPERLLRAWNQECTALPELSGAVGADRVVTALAKRVRERVRDLCAHAGWDEVTLAVRALGTGVAALPGEDRLDGALAALEAGASAREAGEYALAAEHLRNAAAEFGVTRLEELADELARADQEAQGTLTSARKTLASGDVLGAKQRILEALQRWPAHGALRAEFETLDKNSRDRAERLAHARAEAAKGHLEASRQALLGLAVPGREGDDARLLLQEVQGRMDQIRRGLGQVQRSLHGRDTASREGLRHCLARVEQLALVQKDSMELDRLACALRAELAGLDDLEEAEAARLAGNHERITFALKALADRRPTLLDPDRLRARLLEMHDRVRADAEAHLAAGRPHAAFVAAETLARLEDLDAADPAPRLDLRRRCDARIAEAQVCVNEASAFLARHDVEAAEARLDRARELAGDGADVRRLEDRMRAVRTQEANVREVQALAAAEDLAGAARRLADLPPTPPLLRTRIFDLKQSLARAQGLDHGFLLRVDEGGEWLTLRADSITIGNLRDGTSDLQLLANLAGRHARFQRSMSFHGGMQDKIVAERGEVFVNGSKIDQRALRTGDRIRFGGHVEMIYEMPVARSLTARLRLLGGFQVGGATRLLLMKDKGRDGRILLGAGQDCHVQVPGATGEVELFADRDGQIKVRVSGQGEIAGAPFKDEHPVVPGALVRACGITFTLMPWPLA